MSFNEFLTYFFLFFLVLGAIDKCLDNKFGLGKGFEDAWGTATTLILVMIGINSFAPLIGQWLQPVLTPVFHAIGADPSAIAGLLIPGDSGGYFLAMELCESEAAGCYQGLLVSFITGCIMIFTLPVGFASIQKDRQDLVVRGVLYGIITSPIGLIFGGLFSGLSIWEWFCNSIPVLIISLILIVCMLFWQKQLIRFMMISSRILNAILIVLLVIAIFDAKLDFFHIEGLVSFDDGLLIIGSILIFLAGAFPFLNFIRLVFKKPLKRLADKTGINEAGLTGILTVGISAIPAFADLKNMNDRGVIIVSALAVSLAFVFGDHMAFTLSVRPECAAMLAIGKVSGGIAALIMALLMTRKKTA